MILLINNAYSFKQAVFDEDNKYNEIIYYNIVYVIQTFQV